MTQFLASAPEESKASGSVSQKKTLAFCGSKTKYHPMIKTLSSVTLLLLASGWLSILPAETQTKYVCIHCKKEFPYKKTSRCVLNHPENAWNPPGAHEYR